ncbi:iron chelate uptake ABC transporter family permease subunit [Ureaplasma canigenitalium]|uniref:iron chelate uptake ABC transporter family permease subunit n=1 Tax=Ureaplasma canigenitalium TaxID=42092 RepID=UPI0004E1B7B1|nr:iron chelate uptake ABC transporter family permease subunit [Ureaplasma canigenitalium]
MTVEKTLTSQKNIAEAFSSFHKRLKKALSSWTSVGLFTLLFIFIGIGALFYTVMYEKREGEIDFETGQSITTYWRTWEEVTRPATLIDYWFDPIAKIFLAIGIPSVGYAIQITTRNRIASPSTLGYTPAATLAFFANLAINKPNVPWTYLIGFGIALCIMAINGAINAKRKTEGSDYRPVLVGFAIAVVITAIAAVLVIIFPTTVEPSAIFSGSFSIKGNWYFLAASGTMIIVSVIGLFAMLPQLKIMQRDFLLAKSLGIRINTIYWVVSVIAMIMTVCSVVISHPIMLLGLIIPNIVRSVFNKHTPGFVIAMSMVFAFALLEVSLLLLKLYKFGPNFLISIISAIVLIAILKVTKIR